MALRLFQIFFGTSPRTRENGVVFTRGDRELGTSPRMRGKLNHRGLIATPVRNIPAHAGKTEGILAATRSCAEHPRARGENTVLALRLLRDCGTSPRTRGKHLLHQAGTCRTRNIPACAGKTTRGCDRSLRFKEHPRVRGENDVVVHNDHAAPGTSPRARGKRL